MCAAASSLASTVLGVTDEGIEASASGAGSQNALGIFVFRYGSFPLGTYLPDGDLDVGVALYFLEDGRLLGERDSDRFLLYLLSRFNAGDLRSLGKGDAQQAYLVEADVKVIKLSLGGLAVDLSVNKVSVSPTGKQLHSSSNPRPPVRRLSHFPSSLFAAGWRLLLPRSS